MILIDTGPLVALIDRSDQDHIACDAILAGLPPQPFGTTWPCVAEAMHLLGSAGGYRFQSHLWLMRSEGSLEFLDLSASEAELASSLMETYQDLPPARPSRNQCREIRDEEPRIARMQRREAGKPRIERILRIREMEQKVTEETKEWWGRSLFVRFVSFCSIVSIRVIRSIRGCSSAAIRALRAIRGCPPEIFASRKEIQRLYYGPCRRNARRGCRCARLSKNLHARLALLRLSPARRQRPRPHCA